MPEPGASGRDDRQPATLLWTVEQVCTALACRRSWLYDEVEAGRFPVVRLGRQLRFHPADVTAYLQHHTQPAREPMPSAPVARRRRRRTGPRGYPPGPTNLI